MSIFLEYFEQCRVPEDEYNYDYNLKKKKTITPFQMEADQNP